eukprot:Pgem_evm1s1200
MVGKKLINDRSKSAQTELDSILEEILIKSICEQFQRKSILEKNIRSKFAQTELDSILKANLMKSICEQFQFHLRKPNKDSDNKFKKDINTINNKLISTSIDSDTRELEKEQLALKISVKNQNLAVLRKILKNGTNPNFMFNNVRVGSMTVATYITPLHLAVNLQNVAMVRVLIKYGADFSAYDCDGNTALHAAIALENKSIVNVLIEKVAFIDIVNQTGYSPLAYSEHLLGKKHKRVDQQHIFNALKRIGAQSIKPAKQLQELTKEKCCLKCTSALISVNKGHVGCLKVWCVSGKNDVNKRLPNGETLLTLAIKKRSVACVQELIKANVDVNKITQSGLTPLTIAAENGMVDCIVELIQAKADLNKCTVNNRSSTPLMFAAKKGYVSCLTELIKAGADVNKVSARGFTPLIFAAQMGNLKCVQELVKANANVDQFADDGSTPLLFAAQNNHVQCLIELLKAKAGNH